MEGGGKTSSKVEVLLRWTWTLEVSWDEEVVIRYQVISSGLARKDYLSRREGIGKTHMALAKCMTT